MSLFESCQNKSETREAAMSTLRPSGNMQPTKLFNQAAFELK